MVSIKDITDIREIYDYQMRMKFPYRFCVDFDVWQKSFYNDIDGEGRILFKELRGKAAYENDKLVGFIQYGYSAFGFDAGGEISCNISYPIIRFFYFEKEFMEAGRALLKTAMGELMQEERVYAFFHYFGMSCFARHGKLFEGFDWIAKVLQEYGFIVEHENVYYTLKLTDMQKPKGIDVIEREVTKGNQQSFDFMQEGKWIGECEIHYLEAEGNAYLRWIYIDEKLQNQGVGTKCMSSLCYELKSKGYCRMDTDTADNNKRAQYYYEKNGFCCEGVTRSFYMDLSR